MRVFHGIKEFTSIPNPVLSIGTFDGVHVGHRIILNRLIDQAKEYQGESLLITFWPHPRMVLQPDFSDLQLLNTLEEKMEQLQNVGLHNLLIIPFSVEFSRTSPDDFIRGILVEQVGMKKIIIGYDHHFGRNREGSLKILEEYAPILNFDVEEIPPQQIDDINVSSTKIRQALFEGDVELAEEYLGYPYFLSGTVVRGQNIGNQLGFPTANIKVNYPFKLIPGNGVYAVEAKVRGEWKEGMLNIGVRPTFDGQSRTIECHVFNWDEELYAEDIRIKFRCRLRDEMRFSGKDALRNQLETDKQNALKFFGR